MRLPKPGPYFSILPPGRNTMLNSPARGKARQEIWTSLPVPRTWPLMLRVDEVPSCHGPAAFPEKEHPVGIGGYGRMPRSWSWVEWPLSGLPTMGSSDFMKATHRHVSVEVMCERLIRSHLFSPEEVKVLENRWHQESR